MDKFHYIFNPLLKCFSKVKVAHKYLSIYINVAVKLYV